MCGMGDVYYRMCVVCEYVCEVCVLCVVWCVWCEYVCVVCVMGGL